MHPIKAFSICVVALALLIPPSVSQTIGGPPTDPFLDPKNDPYNPLKYIASNTLTAIAFGKLRTLLSRDSGLIISIPSNRHVDCTYPDLLYLEIRREVHAGNGYWRIW